MRISIDFSTMETILYLAMRNDHISASSSGLKARAENRRELQCELLNAMGITEDEAEVIYQKIAEERE